MTIQNFDYKGQVISKRDDGYINLTQMCQANGKKLSHFLCLKSTKAYISAMTSDTGFTASEIIEVVKGGNSALQGSWGHPELAIALAQWISPQFHRWCNAHIFLLMETGSTSLEVDPFEEMKLRIELANIEKEKEALRFKANQSERELIACKNALMQSDPGLYQILVDNKPLAEIAPVGFGKKIEEIHTPDSQGHSLTELMACVGGFDRTKSGFKQSDRQKAKLLLKEIGIDLDTGDGCTEVERKISNYSIPEDKFNEAKIYLKTVLTTQDPNLLERLYLKY